MFRVLDYRSGRMHTDLFSEKRVQKHLTVLRAHHPDTYVHCRRVGLLSIDLGFENGLPEDDIRVLGYAGMLHDVGKAKISLNTLNNTSPLQKEQRRIVEMHPSWGYEMLRDFSNEVVRLAVLGHHRYQPDPYPLQMPSVDSRTSRLTEMVALADKTDAGLSGRPCKPAIKKPDIEPFLRANFTGDPRYIDQVLRRIESR